MRREERVERERGGTRGEGEEEGKRRKRSKRQIEKK